MTNYLGSQPIIGNFVKLDAITVVNGQAAYTMQNGGANFVDYSSVNQFMVSLNSVIQSPGSSFTLNSSTITFASNLVTNDVIDFIIVFGNSLSSGVPTDATVSTAKIVDDAVTLAKMASGTDGNLISYDTSGNPVAVATGSSGQVLTSAGAGAVPSFQAAAAGGKLLQVATDFDSAQVTINSTTYIDTALSISFTPTAADSSLLIFACLQIYTEGNGSYYGASDTQILHDGSTVDEAFTSLSDYQSGAFSYFRTHIARVSSTSNTNARTIKVQLRKGSNANNPNALYNQYGGKSSLIVQEISA